MTARSLLQRLLPVVLVLGICAPAAFSAAGQPESAPSASPIVDFAWVALTPADLPDPGYEQGASSAATPVDYAAESAAAGGLRERLAQDLQDVGLQQAYKSSLLLPSLAHPGKSDRIVSSIVSRWGDEASAFQALELLQAALDISAWDVITPLPQLGDESLLLRKRSVSHSGTPSQWPRLLVRDGAFLFDVWIEDNTTVGTSELGLSQLIEVLQERMREASTGASPGLSDRVLRLDRSELTQLWDGYRRRDGVQMAWSGQPPERFDAMDAYYRDLGILDVYRYVVGWEQWAYYNVDVVRFASTADASARLREFAQQELAKADPNLHFLTEVTDPPPLGDEALVVSYTVATEGMTNPGYGAWIRVGNRVAAVYLMGSEANLATFERLARDETQCLQTGGCWESTVTLESTS